MRSPTSKQHEEYTVRRIAEQYSADGYLVITEPGPNDLPEALKDFQVDLVARRGTETVIVEVKKSSVDKRDPRLVALAQKISEIPNIRLDLVSTAATPKSDNKSLSSSALTARVTEANRLRQLRSKEASIMLLWSATEGTLRLLAEMAHISATTHNPSVLIKNMYSQGVIDRRQYEVLSRAVRYRNAAAHAYELGEIDEGFLERWSSLTLDLLTRVEDA